jgi:hypothetical protein
MEVIVKGSVEPLVVPLRDRLNNIEDLANVSDLKFDTKNKDTGDAVQSDVNCALDSDYPMYALCEIDTTLVGYAAGGDYHLYVKYVAGSEHPILGPVAFRVESD